MTPTAVAAADFHFISSLVTQRSAIQLPPDKHYLVESRLVPLARDLGLGSVADLVAQLRRTRSADLETRVVEAMTTNETSWFRDVHPFESLRSVVLPRVLEANRTTRRLRIWSAACSTGQELYSIAMLLDSTFPELAGWDVQLLGTDINGDVVAKAQAGRYSGLEINRGLPAAHLARYFGREGTHFVVDERLRSRCTFRQMNLIAPWQYLPQQDVVFLRNVLIYFDQPTKRSVLENIRRVLSPAGHLFLGAAETTVGVVDGFVTDSTGPSVVHRVKEL